MAGDLTFRFDDAFAFSAKMAGAPKIVQREMVRGIDNLTHEGAEIAKDILHENDSIITGALLRSVVPTPATFAGGTARGAYGTSIRHAKWIEHGRGPVQARGTGMLRFRYKGVGPWVFRRRVGPAAARPFMRPSVARLRPRIQREGQRMCERIVAQIGGV